MARFLLFFCILTIRIDLSTQQERPCFGSPCVHGTVCFDGAKGFTCDCDYGYTGPVCDKPEVCLNNPCVYGSPCLNGRGGYKCKCNPGFYGSRCENSFLKPCSKISSSPYPILIQQHVGPSNFFNKSWAEMLVEQGSPDGDYWIGLRKLRRILAEGKGRYRLRIDMLGSTSQFYYYTTYDTFMIGTEEENFKLTIGEGVGDFYDVFSYHNGMKFTTYDRDNDLSESTLYPNAASYLGGAFWHTSTVCNACPNGSPQQFFTWNRGLYELKSTAMYLVCKEELHETQQEALTCSEQACVNGKLCFDDHGGYKCNCNPGFYGTRCEVPINKPCSQISTRPYPILIQQHTSDSDFFNKSWTEMLVEQGSPEGDYWIGLRELRQILAEGKGRFSLRVEYSLSGYGAYTYRSYYDGFMIDTEQENFKMTFAKSGGETDYVFQSHNGTKFTTYDRDNDDSLYSNVAALLGGAFWHSSVTCNACVNGSPGVNFHWYPGGAEKPAGSALRNSKMSLYCKEE